MSSIYIGACVVHKQFNYNEMDILEKLALYGASSHRAIDTRK